MNEWERERKRENVRACVINEYHRFYRRYKIASKKLNQPKETTISQQRLKPLR